MAFQKALRTKSKARVVIVGPSGCGKSMTALRIARGLVGDDGRIAARDSEHGSLSKYAVLEGEPETDIAFDFDTEEPSQHSPLDYVRSIHEAEDAGYDCIILDSLSHAWVGVGGALEIVDSTAGSNKFTSGWAKATPMHNEMIEAMTGSSIHVIATLRTKTEYVLEDKNGKKVPRKVGTTPVQRDGMEYEFDLTCTMDREHRLTVDKTRCPDLDDMTVALPTRDIGETLAKWLGQGVDAPSRDESAPPAISQVAGSLTKSQRDTLNTSVTGHADRILEYDSIDTDEKKIELAEVGAQMRLAAFAELGITNAAAITGEHFEPLQALFKRARRVDGVVSIRELA